MDTPNVVPATPAAAPATPSLFDAPDSATEGNDGAPNTAPEAAAEKPPVPVAPSKKSYKFKIDDQEVTEELTDDEVLKHLQKSKGADKRFQEAATLKQQTERFYQLLKEKPLDLIEKIHGEKAREMMEQRLWERIQREKMDPKDRELMETKEQLKQLEAEKKEVADKQQRDQFETLKKEYAQTIDKEITDAIKAAGKTVTPYFFKRVANYMLSAMQAGKQVSPKDVVPLVEQDLQNDLRSMFEMADEDKILQLLGDKALEKVRKADLRRARGGNPPATPSPAAPKEEKKPLDARDLEKRTSLFDWD